MSPHYKFKIGDEVVVREPTEKEIKDLGNFLDFKGQERSNLKEFIIGRLEEGAATGKPYYIRKMEDFTWFPEFLLKLKYDPDEIKLKKLKIKIGSEEVEVSEPIAKILEEYDIK